MLRNIRRNIKGYRYYVTQTNNIILVTHCMRDEDDSL